MARRRSKKRPTVPMDDLYDARPDFVCDLHGHTVDSAIRKVHNDLPTFRRRKTGAVVHVITGKGSSSSGSPRLRPVIGRLLSTEMAPLVANFERDIDDGGFLVRLK